MLGHARAGGLDTVATYVLWQAHEPEPGRFVWSGDRDLRAFVELEARHGLDVVAGSGRGRTARRGTAGSPTGSWTLREIAEAAGLRLQLLPWRGSDGSGWIRRCGTSPTASASRRSRSSASGGASWSHAERPSSYPPRQTGSDTPRPTWPSSWRTSPITRKQSSASSGSSPSTVALEAGGTTTPPTVRASSSEVISSTT